MAKPTINPFSVLSDTVEDHAAAEASATGKAARGPNSTAPGDVPPDTKSHLRRRQNRSEAPTAPKPRGVAGRQPEPAAPVLPSPAPPAEHEPAKPVPKPSSTKASAQATKSGRQTPVHPQHQRGQRRQALFYGALGAFIVLALGWGIQQENVKLPDAEMLADLTGKITTVYETLNLNLNLNLSVPNMPYNLSLPKLDMDMLNLWAQLPQIPGFGGSLGADGQESVMRPGKKVLAKGLAAKHPVVIIPGFVTSQLELWQGQPCATRYFRQRMWGTVSMMQTFLRNSTCWFHHLALDPVTGLDPPGVKLRAAQGLEAVDFFIQGYWVWGKLVEALGDVGYDTNTLASLAFDWRLSIPLMEARDAWFTRTMHSIQTMVQTTGQKVVLISHSYGENVARTFLHWTESRQAGWIEQYVHANVALSGPSLGVPKAITSVLSGEMRDTAQLGALASFLTNRLFSRQTRAQLFRSWGSMMAMLPVGGPKVWGNTSWAPDDTPELKAANLTFGAFVTSTPLCTTGNCSQTTTSDVCTQPPPASVRLDVSQSVQLALQEGGPILQRHHRQILTGSWGAVHGPASNTIPRGTSDQQDVDKIAADVKHSNASATPGAGRAALLLASNTADLPLFPNALTTPLPNAPSLKMYYLYGVGVPTERAYLYNHPDDWCGKVGSNHSGPVASAAGDIDTDGSFNFTINTGLTDTTIGLESGILMGDGDLTVPLISLGGMARGGWRSKRLNPAGIKVTTREYMHSALSMLKDPRGGPAASSHVDFLGNEEMLEDVLMVVTGAGSQLTDRVVSNIDQIVARIPWEDQDGWE